MKKHFLSLLLLIIFTQVHAQRKWQGGISDEWENPLNWQPAGVPASSDDVLLDNSSQKDGYEVRCTTATVIKSLTISPDVGKQIRLLIPPVNISSPALTVTSIADAVVLNEGAVFQNASGLTSGRSLSISGNIRINNGGKYIHQTRSAHANDVVAKLSAAEGTEEGIFEFDIPAASSTISLSNRRFGKLKLSATAYNGSVAYSGGGSNPVKIDSDLEIGESVSFSIGFANVFNIKRHLVQRGGQFNISNDNNATTVSVGGDLIQNGGIITETGTATPVLHINGFIKQSLRFSGGIKNNVILKMDNPSGAVLETPLSLSHRLELKNGKLKCNEGALLTLEQSALVMADSLAESYIEGPLKKEGLIRNTHFLFPVGSASTQRWLALKNATGSFTVSYRQENPNTYATAMSDGLDHISSLEYWMIDAEASPAASAQVEASFDNMHSGGVSDLAMLQVAQLENSMRWAGRGNAATTGTAGSAGSVVSAMINDFSAGSSVFTLGSSSSVHNSLPDNELLLFATNEGKEIRFTCKGISDMSIAGFALEASADDLKFHQVKTVSCASRTNGNAGSCLDGFNYVYRPVAGEKHFRIKFLLRDGQFHYSKVISAGFRPPVLIIQGSLIVTGSVTLALERLIDEQVDIQVHDISGRLIQMIRYPVRRGSNKIVIPVDGLKKGLYVVSILSKGKSEVAKFIKL